LQDDDGRIQLEPPGRQEVVADGGGGRASAHSSALEAAEAIDAKQKTLANCLPVSGWPPVTLLNPTERLANALPLPCSNGCTGSRPSAI
jgi:hypothetical protein